jgi:chemotaxis protein CheX
MNVKFLNPFVEAAFEVLEAETRLQVSRGELRMEKEPYKSDDVTVIINLVGMVEGAVFYSMSALTAQSLAGRILGEELPEFDMLAQSGTAELGNVITGRASVKLATAGYAANISPPTLLTGAGTTISTLDYPRLVVPIVSECGAITIHLALREGSGVNAWQARQPVTQRPVAV